MIRTPNSPEFPTKESARRLLASVVLGALLLLGHGWSFAQEYEEGDTENVDIQADFTDYDKNLGVARATGDVVVKFGPVTIHAGQVEFFQSSGKIFARDNVRVFKGGEVYDAEEVIYDTKTGEMTTSELRSSLEPIFYTSNQINKPAGDDGVIELLDSTFTTHDSADPDFRIKVNKLQVHPGDKIVMHGARVFVRNVPVMYFPYYVQPMNDELGYYFTPGWNSPWGAFLLNRYGFMIGEDILAKARLDLRSERGIAGGINLEFEKFKNNPHVGEFGLYYAHDQNPQMRYNGSSTLGSANENRYRANLQHRIYFPGSEDKTFFVDFDINKLSDEFVHEDFFPAEFRLDPRPDNLVNLSKVFEQGEISLTGRFQLNEFFQSDTRTPELAIDIIRTPLGDTGFFYEGFTTYGILDEELDPDTVLDGIVDPDQRNRFQSYHEFLFPTTLGGWLNVVPRGGAGYSNYSNFETAGVGSFDRTTTHVGLDLSFKLSKRSPNVYSRALGIDGLLHVARPYVNYSLTNTNEIDGRFDPIDRFTLTTRLRPIDLPLFTAVDDLRDWQIVRAGISNKWFTRRNGASHQWLSVNNYIEGYIEDPEFDRNFSNLYTEVEWNPLPWLAASTTAQIPIIDDVLDFSEITSRIYFMPTDNFRFSVGHYYLNNHPFFQDSDLLSLNTYSRITDNWGFSTAHRFEADDQTLEFQQYTVHRDLGSWTGSLGTIIRDNRDGQEEFGVLLSLTLKAFPKVSLPVDFQPGTVGGADEPGL